MNFNALLQQQGDDTSGSMSSTSGSMFSGSIFSGSMFTPRAQWHKPKAER